MISLRKILCPVDFSSCSDHALEYALAFAQAYDAELILLHVFQSPVYGYAVGSEGVSVSLRQDYLLEMERAATDELKALAARVRERYARTADVLVSGVPFVEILKKAKEFEVDLIVMGTHGRTGLVHALIGSVAEKVVRKASCPVLTTKHPEHDFVMP